MKRGDERHKAEMQWGKLGVQVVRVTLFNHVFKRQCGIENASVGDTKMEKVC